MKSTRTTARAVGALLLAAFLLYGIGSSIAMSTEASGVRMTLGVGLMLLNSGAVVAIGALMVTVLRPHSPSVAVGYLVTRLFEAAFLTLGAIALLRGAAGMNLIAYNVAMAGLGIGSLFLCVALYRARLVPGFLAVWGFVGYATFAAGCLLELLGVAGAGVVSAIPGGLFEIFLAVWLLARGFRVQSASIVAARA